MVAAAADLGIDSVVVVGVAAASAVAVSVAAVDTEVDSGRVPVMEQ